MGRTGNSSINILSLLIPSLTERDFPATDLKFPDFEDAVLYASALIAGAECIVTRNCSDFKKARIPVYTPDELVKILTEL